MQRQTSNNVRPVAAAASSSANQDAQRIPVFDDEFDAADGGTTLLRTLGQTARQIGNGTSALELAAEVRHWVVFLSPAMPEVNGPEVAPRKRDPVATRSARILELNDPAERSFREAFADVVAARELDSHLLKPVYIPELSDAMAPSPARSGS